MVTPQEFSQIVLVGIGATAVMDLWAMLLRRLGVPTLNFALIGRWVGHWRQGVFMHSAIAKAPPVKGELAVGWLVHYGVGVVFAALLVALEGPDWVANPSLMPALLFGLVSVAAPWFVMQPAMGAGIAASKTPTPGANRVRSLANHLVFGFGLYLAASLVAWALR